MSDAVLLALGLYSTAGVCLVLLVLAAIEDRRP